jgi:serpin B
VGQLGSDDRAFAFDLYRQVAREADGNLLFSPHSISSALAMTYAGARGTTEREMKQALRFTLEQAPLHEAFNAVDLALAQRGQAQEAADGKRFALNLANSIWLQPDYPVESAFLDVLALNYGAGVYQTDFVAAVEPSRRAINAWVSERTEKLIPELLPPGSITDATRFVLTNAVYFDASWQTKFDPAATSDRPFTRPDGSVIQVSTMSDGYAMPYAESADYQAVSLAYVGAQLSLIAILPSEGKFASVEAALSGAWFDTVVQQLEPASVQIALPKLDYKFHTSLKNALAGLGMNSAFDAEAADFSGLTSGKIHIIDVIHEATVRVYEQGTVAAAATGVIAGNDSAPFFEHQLAFSRPFLFAVYDRPTGTILFLGRVLDPSAK